MLTPVAEIYFGHLIQELISLREVEPTLEVKRYKNEVIDGIDHEIEVSLFDVEVYASWSVSTYGDPNLIAKEYDERALKYFFLTHNGNQELRDAMINFGKQINGAVRDSENEVSIELYEPFDGQNPNSSFVDEVSKYITALRPSIFSTTVTEQVPVSLSTTPIGLTQTPTYIPKPTTKVEPTLPKRDPFYLFRWGAPDAWRLHDIYGDWKDIPTRALERIGYTRRITGGRNKTVEIIPLSKKNDES